MKEQRALIRLICLSIGLLQPGDSRDVIVDVVQVLLNASKERKALAVEEIEQQVIENRKHHEIVVSGIAASNIRRQLKRLRELYLVEKMKTSYRITEFLPLRQLFSEKTRAFVIKGIIERVEEHLTILDEFF